MKGSMKVCRINRFLIRKSFLSSSADFKHHVVIIGGGTAGVGSSIQLLQNGIKLITVIEPSPVHYYQPLWTLAGAGLQDINGSVRPMGSVLPNKAKWVQDSVVSINPDKNQIALSKGDIVNYDYLVIACGLQLRWDKIPGLEKALEKGDSGVCSIYTYNYCNKTRQVLSEFNGGKAIFTMPVTPIKCAGAAQKIMWLFEEQTRERGIRSKSDISYWASGASMFGVKKYSDMLEEERVNRNIPAHFGYNLIQVDSENKKAVFQNSKDGSTVEESYDLLHVTPPMSPPAFLSTSGVSTSSSLVDAAGWVDVDRHSLQSTSHSNVFALGDCCNAPNTKTAAAVMAQVPVVVHNLCKLIRHPPSDSPVALNGHYNGYGSCPLLVSKHRVILAEFGYDGRILETFSRTSGRFPMSFIGQDGPLQQRIFAWMKRYLFPFVYWHLYPKGLWFGTYAIFKPDVTKDSTAL